MFGALRVVSLSAAVGGWRHKCVSLCVLWLVGLNKWGKSNYSAAWIFGVMGIGWRKAFLWARGLCSSVDCVDM